MSKNYLVPTNIIVSLDPCPLSSIFWRRECFRAGFWYVENQSPVTIRHLRYSGLNRQLDLLHHFVSQFPPRKVMRSLVGVHFWVGAAEVVDAPLNCTASCQCALWSLRPFQLSSFFEGDLVMGKVQGRQFIGIVQSNPVRLFCLVGGGGGSDAFV